MISPIIHKFFFLIHPLHIKITIMLKRNKIEEKNKPSRFIPDMIPVTKILIHIINLSLFLNTFKSITVLNNTWYKIHISKIDITHIHPMPKISSTFSLPISVNLLFYFMKSWPANNNFVTILQKNGIAF